MDVGVVVESQNEKGNSEENQSCTCTCDWKKHLRRKLPVVTWLPLYDVRSFVHDLLAGFTVALTEIPQSMVYAGIAGLPLQYGLYSSFMGGFVYFFFGSCKAINMGSTSLMALLIQSHVATMGLDASTFMSFVGGILILVLGLVNSGFVIEFFSYPIMAGFTSAAALTIASSQIHNLLGIQAQADQFVEAWSTVIKNIESIKKWDAVLGCLSLAGLIFLKEISVFSHLKSPKSATKREIYLKKIIFFLSVAKNAIIVIVGMTIAYVLEQNGYSPFQLTGHVEGGYPPFEVPPPIKDNFKSFGEMMEDFGVSAAFIPLVAILETIAVAKVFSQGKALDGSQEMIALGIANLLGSFVLSMPVSGSFTRTAVNHASGAQTNMAAVFTGITIIVALKFLTSTFYYIPKSTLAAVIICAMFYLFDFEAFVILWRRKKLDLIPFGVTLFSSIFISLEYGILLGIATNLTFVLYSVARPSLNLEKLKFTNNLSEVYLVTPSTTIYFPAAEHMRSSILKCEKDSVIIVDGRNLESMDITVAKTLSDLAEKIESRQQKIFFINFKPSIQEVCTGVNKKLINQFRVGEVEDLIQDRPSMDSVPRLSEIYSTQT